jgi:DNA replication protein DnaC
MHQQAAGYPFQFRLAQFDKEIPTHKQNVFLFLKPSNPPKHLLIFGSKKSGSTSLAVGIATEKSISHQRCTYTTAMKLFSMFSESEDNSHAKDSNLWTWRNCSLLVVDDINPGSPVNDVISPATFLHMLDAQREVNRNALRNKSVIWVMGNQDSSSKGWCALLEILGIQPRDVLVVHIS